MTATQTRPYALVRPCPRCPFRTDVEPYLRPGRAAEIAREVQGGSEFFCHETTVPDPDDDAARTKGEDSLVCAGSMILMEKSGRPNQMLRIAGRIGMYDPDRLDMDSPVSDSWSEWVDRFREDEPGEPCNVVGPGCEAPAGWGGGGGIVENLETFAEFECWECGTPACGACSHEAEREGEVVRVCEDCEEG